MHSLIGRYFPSKSESKSGEFRAKYRNACIGACVYSVAILIPVVFLFVSYFQIGRMIYQTLLLSLLFFKPLKDQISECRKYKMRWKVSEADEGGRIISSEGSANMNMARGDH